LIRNGYFERCYHLKRIRSLTFAIGDPVEKFTGDYTWDGVVCSRFTTPDGKLRYVVAHPILASQGSGWVLHIYSEANLQTPS
jgi:hypothetical protein